VIFRKFSTLQLALGASLAVHGLLLSVRLVDPKAFNRAFQDTPLEVILVNSRSNQKPGKAQAIAQANLAGGGNAGQGRATSPLPASAFNTQGNTLENAAASKLHTLQEQQTLLLSTVKQQLASLPPPATQELRDTPEPVQREAQRLLLSKQLAEIERRIRLENAQPRKRTVGPSTREEVYAVYYDHLRHTIEDRGTADFPSANGKKLYGELTMAITVNAEGRVLQTEVVQGSGNAALDHRAEAIARAAGPFGRFSSAMRKQADQLWVVSRFRFTRDEILQTEGITTP
jgi:periplasmic protein TonB